MQYATLKKRASAFFKFGIITLNAKHKLAGIHIIGTGAIDRVYIEPRDVFMAAMINNAKAIIAFHPSGDPTPSRGDIILTYRLKEAGVAVLRP